MTKRSTIDFGIDLGTTNSAIAVLNGVSTEIIKNNADTDVTPSVVSIDKKGAIYVGQRAKNRLREFPDDVFGEFKRRMGTDFVYAFRASGEKKRPEELSAEVIRSLRTDVEQRTGEIIESAVITVPAAFELHQCDATRKAAQLAGLKDSPLLQEPVAAALAYGFQVDKQKSYWLVYDFGGGTFDAALVKSEDGTIHVVNHGGDNFLGGADIDWAIVNRVLIPRLLHEHKLEGFERENPRWRQVFAKLKWYAEAAKIELSRSDKTTADPIRFQDYDGDEVEFECEISKADVVGAAEPYIRRSVEICHKVLTERKLDRTAVERVILVGGPTLAPYFREMLTKGLGIPLDHRVDPMTAVARGAAIFAGTQRVTAGSGQPAKAGEFLVEFKHQPVGLDSSPMVGGRVSGPAAKDFTGYTVEMVSVKSKWSSGKLALRADGMFIATLHAERGDRNIYAFGLFDPSGRKQKTSPESLTYTIGAVVEEQPIINSMGIALGNNDYEKLFEKGRGLPLKATTTCRTIRAIRRGQSDELKIPVIEGEQSLADRNRWVGELKITGEDVPRDLPVGSEIEVTLQIDESRIVTVNAYVPVLDKEFKTTLVLRAHSRERGALQEDYDAEMARFAEVKAKAGIAGGDAAEKLIRSAENSEVLQEVRELLAREGDPDAAAKCEKRLLELKIRLDRATDELQWPSLIAEAREWIGYLAELDKEQKSDALHKRCVSITAEIEQIIGTKSSDDLRHKIEQARSLWLEINMAQPAFWVYQHQELEKRVGEMSDKARASRLLEQGRAFVSQNNATGLQNVVRELWNLLPDDANEGIAMGYQAGIVKSR
jgi:molecular chaperone DnaK